MKTEKDELEAEDLNLITLAQQYSDNDKARELLESLRWPNGPVWRASLQGASRCLS
jgi:DICT domain-containing protein